MTTENDITNYVKDDKKLLKFWNELESEVKPGILAEIQRCTTNLASNVQFYHNLAKKKHVIRYLK